jgi:uncharacterized membrane protein
MIGLLALVGVAASATFFSRPPYNPGFLKYPTIIGVHVILGALYLALAPFQFVKGIRSRWLDYHRWAGRLLVATGLLVGASGLFVAWVIPFWGWAERVILGFFGGLFALAIGKGFLHARAGQIALHREWMIRAFAVGLGIASQRLFLFPAIMIMGGEPTHQQVVALAMVTSTFAFTLHAALGEVWIRVTRRKQILAVGALPQNIHPLLTKRPVRLVPEATKEQ